MKHDYATLSTPGTKKISVCSRRVGSRDRLSVIAVCTDESTAEAIVEAMNLRQGKLGELDTPAQRVLAEVRNSLASERDVVSTSRRKISDLEGQLRIKTHELAELGVKLRRVELERDAAQKTARESA